MRTRWIVLQSYVRSKLGRCARRSNDAALRTRYLIVLHADRAMAKSAIARALGCSRQTVDRVIRRYRGLGEAGLMDRREDNGSRKVDTFYISILQGILNRGPQDFGYRRPTWTHRLLIDVARQATGIRISRRTMGRLLLKILSKPEIVSELPALALHLLE